MESQDLIIDDVSPELIEKVKKLFSDEGWNFERQCRIETVIDDVETIEVSDDEGGDADGGAANEKEGEQDPNKLKCDRQKWYNDLLKKTVETSPDKGLKYAAIVSFPEAVVLGTFPKDFDPDKQGILNIIAALEGDTANLAEAGMMLGAGCKPSVPGKLDAGKAIYGTDGSTGGTDAFRSKKSLLVGSYVVRPAASTRLLRKTAQYMEDQGR